MSNMWNFSQEPGQDRDLITLYILHSLNLGPKSGYDIMKEMSDKTGGAWTPSKGTVYPLIKSLEREGLVHVVEVGKRSKNILGLTKSGEKALKKVRNQKPELRERLYLFKCLLMEIFGAEMYSMQGILMEIRMVAEEIPAEKRLLVMSLLEETLEELRSLESDD